jgi:hypothetical protein
LIVKPVIVEVEHRYADENAFRFFLAAAVLLPRHQFVILLDAKRVSMEVIRILSREVERPSNLHCGLLGGSCEGIEEFTSRKTADVTLRRRAAEAAKT